MTRGVTNHNFTALRDLEPLRQDTDGLMDFVDDLVLFVQRVLDMEESLSQLVRYTAEVGLKVNLINRN